MVTTTFQVYTKIFNFVVLKLEFSSQTLGTETLAPCIAKLLLAMVLAMQDKWILGFKYLHHLSIASINSYLLK